MNELHYDVELNSKCRMYGATQSEIIARFKRTLIGNHITNWEDVINWCKSLGCSIVCCENESADWANYDDKTGVTL